MSSNDIVNQKAEYVFVSEKMIESKYMLLDHTFACQPEYVFIHLKIDKGQ